MGQLEEMKCALSKKDNEVQELLTIIKDLQSQVTGMILFITVDCVCKYLLIFVNLSDQKFNYLGLVIHA